MFLGWNRIPLKMKKGSNHFNSPTFHTHQTSWVPANAYFKTRAIAFDKSRSGLCLFLVPTKNSFPSICLPALLSARDEGRVCLWFLLSGDPFSMAEKQDSWPLNTKMTSACILSHVLGLVSECRKLPRSSIKTFWLFLQHTRLHDKRTFV